MEYLVGRNNLSCTVFVPVVCGNNCSFCTSKDMYKNFEFNWKYFNKIIDQIKLLNRNDDIKEYVLTGGEPLFDLNITRKIVLAMEKPVYINTSLPLVENIDEVIDFINYTDKIRGVNISRHLNTIHTVSTADVRYINKIKKPVRINSVITRGNLDIYSINEFINRYSPHTINFRADYRNVTKDTLKTQDDIFTFLFENFKWRGNNGCLVCNTDYFTDIYYNNICYHRGLERSCVIVGNNKYHYINDVIIDIHGNIHKDWDLNKEDKGFTKWITKS